MQSLDFKGYKQGFAESVKIFLLFREWMLQYGIHKRSSMTLHSSQLIPVKVITFYIPMIYSKFVSPIRAQVYHMDYPLMSSSKIL